MPATPFLGRSDDLEAVATLLGREDVGLVTLTGPGGMGKTRLALQAAADAADEFADGVWWIPLAPLEDPSLVFSTIAQTLQIAGAGGEVTATVLRERLSGRDVLVVIDDAEHLLPAVADAVAHLAAIDGPCLCVTSRERLALPGEHVFTVPALSECDSVALFVARARQLDPAFAQAPGLAVLAANWTIFHSRSSLPRLGRPCSPSTSSPSDSERVSSCSRPAGAVRRGTRRCRRQSTGHITCSEPKSSGSIGRLRRSEAAARWTRSSRSRQRIRTRSDRCSTRASSVDAMATEGHVCSCSELVRRHAADLLAEDPGRGRLAAASARYFTELTETAFARVTSFAADNGRWWGVMRDERDNVRTALAFHHAAGDAESLARTCAGEWFLWFSSVTPSRVRSGCVVRWSLARRGICSRPSRTPMRLC